MNILSIAGSDPSSGAGIQSDIRTFTILEAYPLTVITSITNQNTKFFGNVEPVSPQMIKKQLDSVFADFQVDAVKIGMVYNSTIIKAIHSKISKIKIPIILDPVIKSTTGGNLIKKSSIKVYNKFLIPLAFVITPNIFEASILSGIRIKDEEDLLKSAKKLKEFGAKNVIITGCNFKKGIISDFVLENFSHYFISGPILKNINHGSGCNFSAAITVSLAKGKNIKESVEFAKKFTYDSIKNSSKIGNGFPITQPVERLDLQHQLLKNSIEIFQNLKNSYKLIPECQTNFVYSKEKIRSIKDILGVSGRIVKAGKKIVVAGDISYGGSKHVGTALLECNKKFPQIRSAINIKFDQKLILKCMKNKMHVLNYNRKMEPKKTKQKENSSISWGIKNALKNSKKIPDLIYHRGDFGKEPMIIVFGETPKDVINKVSKIL